MDPLHTLADWRRAYDDGAQPLSLLRALVARLAHDDTAWIHRCDTDHIAAQVAALPPRGEATPLWGVPFAVKDNIDVQACTPPRRAPRSPTHPRSATVVQRLQAAGAVLVGKTNLDQSRVSSTPTSGRSCTTTSTR